MANIIYNSQLRKLAKRANERIRQLERKEPSSPALKKVQAVLQYRGKQGKGSAGRRFSETGKGTRNEIMSTMKDITDFLNMKTSTVSGTRKLRKEVYQSADEEYGLSEYGITQDEYFEIWNELPDSERDRLFSSDRVIEIIQSVKQQKPENQYTISELINKIQSSKSIKDAYKNLGLKMDYD